MIEVYYAIAPQLIAKKQLSSTKFHLFISVSQNEV